MGHLAKQRDASFFRVFFNPYHYGVLTQNYSTEVDQQRLSFGEALLKLTESELQYRRDQEIKKRIQQAKFPIVKRIDEFDFNFQPSINKQEILELKSLGFLNNHQNILLVGSPGVGKTHLAIGLGLIACEHGFKKDHVYQLP